jgi:AcrR family transcriptional regulator
VTRPSVEVERRAQLTAAAARVIARKGYGAATVRDVAAEAGTSTGTVMYYYAGKEELFADTLRAASEAFRARMAAAIAEAGDDPVERLLAIARAATPGDPEAARAHAVWIDFWAQAARDESLRNLNERIYDGWRAAIADQVRAGQAAGAFRADADPDVFARGFAAVLDGLATHVVLHGAALDAAAMEDTFRAYARAALTPQSASTAAVSSPGRRGG